MPQDSNSILDTELLGFYIRRERIDAGYQKAEDFAEALTKQVGYPVSKQTIYNVESGKQEPKLSLYLAMMRLLNPDDVLVIDPMVKDSLPQRWKLPLNALESLPDDQLEENEEAFATLADACSSIGNMVMGSQGEVLREIFGQMSQSLTELISAPIISDTVSTTKEILGNMVIDTARTSLALIAPDDEAEEDESAAPAAEASA